MSRELCETMPVVRRWLYRLCFALFPLLPLSVARWIGWAIGYLAWFADGKGRRTAYGNMRRLLGDNNRHLATAVRRSFINFCLTSIDNLHMHRLRPVFAHMRVIDPCGLLAGGVRGPIIFTTVHANWEAAIASMTLTGHIKEAQVISLSHGDPAIDALYQRARASWHCRSVHLDQAPLAGLRALRAGAIVCLVADRNYSPSGIICDFLGRPTRLPVGPAALAVQTGAPVIPALFARRQTTAFTMLFAPPQRPRPGMSKNHQVAELSQRLADIHGRFLRVIPDQWVAFHDIEPEG